MYDDIARIFAEHADYNASTIDYDSGRNDAHQRLAEDLADYFQEKDSWYFNRHDFLVACGAVS